MAASLTFNVPAPCAGGNHLIVAATLTIGGTEIPLSLAVERGDLKSPISEEDRQRFLYLMLRVLIAQAPANVTGSQIRNALNNTTLNLSAAGT